MKSLGTLHRGLSTPSQSIILVSTTLNRYCTFFFTNATVGQWVSQSDLPLEKLEDVTGLLCGTQALGCGSKDGTLGRVSWKEGRQTAERWNAYMIVDDWNQFRYEYIWVCPESHTSMPHSYVTQWSKIEDRIRRIKWGFFLIHNNYVIKMGNSR